MIRAATKGGRWQLKVKAASVEDGGPESLMAW